MRSKKISFNGDFTFRPFLLIKWASGEEKITPENGWFIVAQHWMPEDNNSVENAYKKDRRISHGKIFKIKNRANNAVVYRVLRLSANMKGAKSSGQGDIVIDWSAWIELNDFKDDLAEKVDLEISKATLVENFLFVLKHPDQSIALAGKLALLSLFLGVISLVASFS